MHSHKMQLYLKILFGTMSVFMIILVIHASLKSNLLKLPSVVIHEPWFQTTLVDFYLLIMTISVWIIYKERSILRSMGWILAIILLGSIAVSFYVFIQLCSLKKEESFERVLLRKEKGRS